MWKFLQGNVTVQDIKIDGCTSVGIASGGNLTLTRLKIKSGGGYPVSVSSPFGTYLTLDTTILDGNSQSGVFPFRSESMGSYTVFSRSIVIGSVQNFLICIFSTDKAYSTNGTVFDGTGLAVSEKTTIGLQLGAMMRFSAPQVDGAYDTNMIVHVSGGYGVYAQEGGCSKGATSALVAYSGAGTDTGADATTMGFIA